jgi:hypothetical protein
MQTPRMIESVPFTASESVLHFILQLQLVALMQPPESLPSDMKIGIWYMPTNLGRLPLIFPLASVHDHYACWTCNTFYNSTPAWHVPQLQWLCKQENLI